MAGDNTEMAATLSHKSKGLVLPSASRRESEAACLRWEELLSGDWQHRGGVNSHEPGAGDGLLAHTAAMHSMASVLRSWLLRALPWPVTWANYLVSKLQAPNLESGDDS